MPTKREFVTRYNRLHRHAGVARFQDELVVYELGVYVPYMGTVRPILSIVRARCK